MLTVELKVNGTMVGHIYARNVTGTKHLGNQNHLYHWEYYRPEQRTLRQGTVTHVRDDGIEQLISIILSEVDK